MSDIERISICSIIVVSFLVAAWWKVRTHDTSDNLPQPTLPARPDAYELAYLRGGTRELARVISVSLIERRHLALSSDKNPLIVRSGGPPMDDLLDIERAVVTWCGQGRAPADMFKRHELADQLGQYCDTYRRRLTEQQLLTIPELRDHVRFVRTLSVIGIITTITIAFLPLSPPAHIHLWGAAFAVSVIALLLLSEPSHASKRGRALLRRLRQALGPPATQQPAWNGGPYASGALLVGVFGVGALAATGNNNYRSVFAHSAGTGGGCGSCGGCGSGCGGGCGGGCGD